ncbi:hypothetical protein [Streptomyces sp. TLI_185]|uniref:hypothetical protein n=1 Tax=Streptomyces sp. TLI_185 TaxID=2485151 RepID=UPI000F95293C|nr:hypothetical protein [Streptomyces sp. TLI_185]RPF34209.1 hypothetical protein EDD92_4154 [Streptomyces sp. TLI_185]
MDVLTADGNLYGQEDTEPIGPIAPVTYPTCTDNRSPAVQSVTEKAPPTDTFFDYARITPTTGPGGGSTFSVTLPDGRRGTNTA